MVKTAGDTDLVMVAEELSKADPVMAGIIERVGIDDWGRLPTRTHFEALISIIIGQQLSGKAAQTIFGRVRKLCDGNISIDKLVALSDEEIRGAGISRPKLRALRSLQEAILGGTLKLRSVSRMSDDDAFEALTAVKGIGPWTAQIYLMFVLRRPNLFPTGDLGLQKAICENYRIDRDMAAMIELAEKWRPYRTYACWFLWRWLNTEASS